MPRAENAESIVNSASSLRYTASSLRYTASRLNCVPVTLRGLFPLVLIPLQLDSLVERVSARLPRGIKSESLNAMTFLVESQADRFLTVSVGHLDVQPNVQILLGQ